MIEEIPEAYLDGCTFFPDSFGRISHKHVCMIHDIDYWFDRTLIAKIQSDFRWLVNLNKAHVLNKIYWRILVFFASILGFLALSTFGLIFWKIRHQWDKM